MALKGKGHPAISDRIYTEEEADFLRAIERFQRATGKHHPTWTEVLGVFKDMGYRRCAGDEERGDWKSPVDFARDGF
jgi:hypothetical protein